MGVAFSPGPWVSCVAFPPSRGTLQSSAANEKTICIRLRVGLCISRHATPGSEALGRRIDSIGMATASRRRYDTAVPPQDDGGIPRPLARIVSQDPMDQQGSDPTDLPFDGRPL